MHEATQQWNQTGKPARVFTEFDYRTKKTKKGGWDRERRVVAKAEHIDGKENPRFVVTSLRGDDGRRRRCTKNSTARAATWRTGSRSSSVYSPTGSARKRCAPIRCGLYLSAMAYVLVSGLRRLGLNATELAQAQVSTIRTKLLKIGAQIRVTVRKVWVSMASSYPWQSLYQQVWTNLRC